MLLLQLLAIDHDQGVNKQIRYTISSPSQTEFKIGRKSGELSVKKSLAGSANKEYMLTVMAEDLGNIQYIVYSTVAGSCI